MKLAISTTRTLCILAQIFLIGVSRGAETANEDYPLSKPEDRTGLDNSIFWYMSFILSFAYEMVRDICDPFDDSRDDWEKATSVYEFHVHTMDREIVSMKQYHGHPLIIVNVALNSTTTSSDLSFKELIELDKKYYSKGLRILAFPCNDLIKKDEDVKLIKDYVWDHHVKFQVFDFISLSGFSQNKLFKYLRNEAGGVLFGPILWDFTKFIIDKDGHVVERFGSKIPIDILEKYL